MKFPSIFLLFIHLSLSYETECDSPSVEIEGTKLKQDRPHVRQYVFKVTTEHKSHN